jgi:hypothetical protein
MYHQLNRVTQLKNNSLLGCPPNLDGFLSWLLMGVVRSHYPCPISVNQALADDPASAACGYSINLSNQVPFLPELPVNNSCII